MTPPDLCTPEWITSAAQRIRNNEVGLVPFDTLWGLVGRITPSVIDRIFKIKQRPPHLPLLVVIGTWEQIDRLCTPLTREQTQATQQYWPGPTTLILPKKPELPPGLTGGAAGIAVRYPDADWVTALINEVGEPLISTSANRHGEPVPSSSKEWDVTIQHQCDFTASIAVPMTGTPSTIIDCLTTPHCIIRATT